MPGMFSYGPGRIPPPIHLGLPQSLIAGSFPPGNVATVNPIRQAKRLYIGGITDSMTEEQLLEFFNKLMLDNKLGGEPGDPINQVHINQEKSFAFLEVSYHFHSRHYAAAHVCLQFRTPEEATAAVQFDGTMCDGIPLRVRRPKDYIGIDPSLGPMPGVAGTTVGESPNKLFVGGLPTYLNDEQVMELLKSFGELRTFNLVKEGTGQTGVSKVNFPSSSDIDCS
jgi:splicing factor U2AF subunit